MSLKYSETQRWVNVCNRMEAYSTTVKMYPREGKRVGITGDISILLRFYSRRQDEAGVEGNEERSAMQIGLNSSTKRQVPVRRRYTFLYSPRHVMQHS